MLNAQSIKGEGDDDDGSDPVTLWWQRVTRLDRIRKRTIRGAASRMFRVQEIQSD